MFEIFKYGIRSVASVLLMGGMLVSGPAGAAAINILWYTGGVADSSTTQGGGYKASISTLIARNVSAQTASLMSSTNTWASITDWDSGTTAPTAPSAGYDVLVTTSRIGSWNTNPNYTDLNTAIGSGGSITLGDRIMVTGQDADWHYLNNGPHNTTFNSSQGFLVDAINWAASGTGMGAVFLDNPTATMTAMLDGLGSAGSLGATGSGSNSVTIPAGFASFPINESLTTAGLSNWGQSSHQSWSGFNTADWTGINLLGSSTTSAVTLVSATTAGGSTSVPEPGTLAMFGLGLAGLGFLRRRRSV